MIYKCEGCGHIFDEEDAKIVHDHVGDFWGVPAYQDFMECPECGDDNIEEYHEEEDEEE